MPLITYGISIMGLKVIRRQQLEFDAVPEAFLGQAVAGSVEVTVKAAAYIVFMEQLQNLRTFITFVPGRIVQKYDLPLLPCRF